MVKRLFLWTVLAGAGVPAVHALTLEQAVVRAVASHPELSRWQAAARAAAAEQDAAAQAPPLVIGTEFEGPLGIGDAPGADAGEGTLRLSRVLERGNKRILRREAGAARLRRAELERELQYVALMAETVQRFTDVVASQSRLDVAHDRLDLAEVLYERVARRVEAARSSQAEAHGAKAELARARLEMIRSEGTLAASRARLASLWGDPVADFGRAEAELFILAPIPDLAEVQRDLARHPDLQRLAAERQVAEREAELARSQRRADITASAGAKYLGELDTGGFMLEFSMPLGTASRAEPAIRAAQEQVLELELTQASRHRNLAGVAAALIAELNARKAELAMLDETALPEARAAVTEYQAGFEAGRHSFLVVADAQRRLVEIQSQAITVAADFHRLMTELEQLTYRLENKS